LYFSPGGFHAFEHRWAVAEAFEFHASIGKARIQERIHALASQLNEGLITMSRVRLHTPRDPRLSAGIVSLDVEGTPARTVVERLRREGIVLSVAPYGLRCVRATPTIVNTPEEIERVLRALHPLGRGSAFSTQLACSAAGLLGTSPKSSRAVTSPPPFRLSRAFTARRIL